MRPTTPNGRKTRSLQEIDQHEEAPDEYRSQLQQGIQQQITRLGGLIDDLLQGVVISDLNSKERLFMAARFIALQQRATEIDSDLEGIHIEALEDMSLISLVRKVQAESERQSLRLVDAGIRLYQEDENDGEDE
jgi:hypothetical protein